MQLYDSNAWKPLVQTLKNICPVTVMCCSKDGISVKDFDDKHIAMVSLHLRPDEFYCFDVPKKTKLGVDWSLIHKFIQSSSGPLLFEIKEEKLIIHFKETSTAVGFVSVTDVEEFGYIIPEETKDEHVFEMSSKTFRDVVEKATLIGDQLQIEVGSNCVRFAIADEQCDMNVSIPTEYSKPSFSVCVSPQYLQKCLPILSLTKTMTLSLRPNFPIRLHFTLLNQLGTMQYFVAPKIEY